MIDVNRPPDGANLYPGRDTPKLCPTDTFDQRPLYRDAGPGEEEVARRLELATGGPTGRAAVRRLQHLLTAREPGGESSRVLHAAQAVEDVWEELRPRPPQTRNGS